jgi:hypothetical protein
MKIIYVDSQLRSGSSAQNFTVDLSALQREPDFSSTQSLKVRLIDIAVDNIWDLQGCYFTLVEGDVGCDAGDITETFINLYTDADAKYTPQFTNYLQLYDLLVVLKTVLEAKSTKSYTYTMSVDEYNRITIEASGSGTASFRLKNMSTQMMAIMGSSASNYPTARATSATFYQYSSLCIYSISVLCSFIKTTDVYTSANKSEQMLCKLYKKNGFRWMEKRISRFYTVRPTDFTNFQVQVMDNWGNPMLSFPEWSFCLKLT